MFQEGNYDIISFPMPAEGMNQFISPEILPPKFANYLENILPTPFGSGQVRYGTRNVNFITDVDASVMETFLFVKADGSKQSVFYFQTYTQDESIEDVAVLDQNQFTFTSNDNAARYIVNTPIKIAYSFNEANYTLYSEIIQVEITEDVNVQITLGQNFFPAGGVLVVQSINYAVGEILVYDFDLNTFTDPLKTGLSVACIPRSAFFQDTLLICNGVDKILSWDGNNLIEVVDFVKERYANAFNRIDNNNFSFTKLNGFDANKYFVGNLIQLKVDGLSTTLTITNVVIADNLVTITTEQVLPAFDDGNVVELFYQDWPPTFNYIFSGTDRLWALGTGPAGIEWRTADQALIIYYTFVPNTVTQWFNENTKTVPYIDVSDKHGIPDNLEAICQVNGLTALIGRSRTQVWSGTIPGQGGNFSWSSNLNVGIAHGNLLINLSNDSYFVSQSGLQSFSTLNIAKQFAATSSNAIDPIISEFLQNVMGSDVYYRACRSFKYEQGAIGGFKLGQNKLLVSLFQTNFYAWTFFSGDFQKSSAFLDAGDALYLSIGNQFYQYADGNNGSQKLYGDRNGTSLISFCWIPGLVKNRNKRYANKRYELILNYPSSFPLNNLNTINLTINGYIPRAFQLNDTLAFQNKGDVLGEVSFGNFRLFNNFDFVNKKLKFVSSGFWVRLNGYTVNGPLSFKELKLFGVGERNG